jgi:hypothetical protein
MRGGDDEGSVLTEGRGSGRRGQERRPDKLGRLDGQPGSGRMGDALAPRPARPVVLGVVLMILRLVGAVGGGGSGQTSPGGGRGGHPETEYTREEKREQSPIGRRPSRPRCGPHALQDGLPAPDDASQAR